jgi:DNA-binding response OmpR family regulator
MRLLVVEDEKRMADLLKKALQEEGYSVTTAADGKAAVEMAQASEFELILLGVMLPSMDGLQVAQRLRRAGNRVSILC